MKHGPLAVTLTSHAMRTFSTITACLMLPALVALPARVSSGAATDVEQAISVLAAANAPLQRIVYDNGLICLLKRDASAPTVAVQIWVRVGSVHQERLSGGGLCHAIEHMIFKGTATRGVGDITRELHDAGGEINAYTSMDRTVFHCQLPARNWRVGLDVLIDAVTTPSFPAEEWTKEKDVILREISMGRDDPSRVIGKLLWSTAYTEHPYRFPVIGYEDILKTIDREDIANFTARHYVPENMIVVVVGDIDPAAVEQVVRESLGALPRPPYLRPVLAREPPQAAPRLTVKTGAYNVSRLQWAYHTTALADRDTPALDILAEIVGQGRSSRLVSTLKEQRGLVHSISAWSYTPRDPGMFGITASFDPAKKDAVLAALGENIAAWADAEFLESEIAKARRNILCDQLAELQTMQGQANSYGSGEFYAANPRLAETYLARISEIDADDLRRVARKYLYLDNQTVVVLSPAQEESTSQSATPETALHAIANVAGEAEMPVLVREDHRLPFAYLCLALRGGLLSEKDENAGITRLLANLLIRGTEARAAERIAEEVDALGGKLLPFSGYNSFGLRARCLVQDLDVFMELLAECMLRPAFLKEQVEKEKSLQLAAIERERERPFFLAQEVLRGAVFEGHPYRWSPLGSEETVAGLTGNDLRLHLKNQLGADNIALAVFGDVTAEQVKTIVARHFTKIPSSTRGASSVARPRPQLPRRIVQHVPKEQAIVLLGFPGVAISDPRADALELLSTAVSGLSSDLALEVREKRGLAYYVGSYQQPGIDPGIMVFYAGTRGDAASEVEAVMMQETSRLATEGLRLDEFERARNRIIADFESSLQDNMELAMVCALNELYGMGFNHAFTRKERFEALTPEDVRRAAASILSTNLLAVSVVLPAADAAADPGTDQ